VDTGSEKEWTFHKIELLVSQIHVEMMPGGDRNGILLIRINSNGPSVSVTYFVQVFL